MTLERGSGVALWRQIYQFLRGEIVGGRLKPGAHVPPEHQLAQRFGVNRHTVRRATATLEDEGLIRVEQGRGMFVAEHVIDYLLGTRTRFTEDVARHGQSPKGRVLATARVKADAVISEALHIPQGTPVGMVRRLCEAEGRPVALVDHYFDLLRFPDIVERIVATHSVTLALDELGVPSCPRKVTKVTTRLPDRTEAELLQQPRNRPVLVSEAINTDPGGRPVELGIARFAGDRVQIVFTP